MPIGSQLVRIPGSTVLLTGASGGIGHAIARALAGGGASLTISGRRAEVLQELASDCSARVIAADLADREQVADLIAQTGSVDILVANAALPASGLVQSYTPEQVDRSLEVNLRAPVAIARALLPGMIERGHGHLVFMSSLSGKAATPGSALYSAAKFGLRGFAGALREDLRDSGVGVSTIFPGFIRDAGMFADSGVKLPPGVGTRTPEDVARAVVRAIERNRGEVDVAPLALRLSTVFAGVAPEAANRLGRLLGSQAISRELGEAQRDKR
jgi:short-subunit dehydrogenase